MSATQDKLGASEDQGSEGSSGRTRQRSQIEFPYSDLGAAIEVVQAIHSNAGDRCTSDQLAAWMGSTVSSGTFRSKMAVARMFQVIEGDRGGDVCLSELGKMLVNPDQEREGKAKAFLAVPLFSKVFEDHKGHVLPPTPKAIEMKLTGYGVPSKQADRARQVLERSAELAGFFSVGRNRLVMPHFQTKVLPPSDASGAGEFGNEAAPPQNDGSGNNKKPRMDPVIAALIEKLPLSGSDWSIEERVSWLQMISMAFEMAYNKVGVIEIQAKKQMRPDLGSGLIEKNSTGSMGQDGAHPPARRGSPSQSENTLDGSRAQESAL